MSAWGGPPSSGAWANQVDEEEEENGGELDPVPSPAAAAFPALGGDTAFPALGESINIKDSKKDRKQKKVKNTMSLGAFVAAGRKEPEVINLPTGPRQRTADEEERRGGLGGGFRNYGGDRGGGFDRRERDEEGGFGAREEEGPSRADAADDWGTKKAFVPSGPTRGGFSDRDRGSSFGDRDRERGGGFGERYSERRTGFGEGDLDRADTAEKWGSKTFEPSASGRGGFSERGGGFGDRDRLPSDRSRDGESGFSKADSEDKWSRRAPTTDSLDRLGSTGPSSRPKLALKPRSSELPPLQSAPSNQSEASNDAPAEPIVVPRSGPKPNPFGNAKPVDVKEKAELPAVREPAAADASADTEPEKPALPKQRSNPFGSARPREEVLKEKAGSQTPPVAEEESPSNPIAEAADPPAESAKPAESASHQQAVEVTLDAPDASPEAETAKPEATVSSSEDMKGHDSSVKGGPAAKDVEAVTQDLKTKVKVEHGTGQEAEPALASQAESEAIVPGGSWAKIAAAPKSVESTTKQGIEA